MMKNCILYGWVLLLAFCFLGVTEASPAQAEAIIQNYELSHKLWVSELKRAPNDQARRIVMAKRPDVVSYSSKLQKLIAGDLANEWTLKYGAWLLETDTNLSQGSQDVLLNTVEKYHISSPQVGRFCLALVNLRQGNGVGSGVGGGSLKARGIKILEDVKKKNPSIPVQGQAALAISIILSSMGEDSMIMQRRLANLREAVLKSEGVKSGDLLVNDIINEELYKINNLSKGRKAPDVIGLDSARRPVNLSDYQGKVVMLVFWSAWDEASIKVLEILKKAHETREGKPFVILGVNRDDFMTLRRIEAENMIEWKSVSDPQQEITKKYRVSSTPYCMVLDKKGTIAYRGLVGSFASAVADELMLPKPLSNN